MQWHEKEEKDVRMTEIYNKDTIYFIKTLSITVILRDNESTLIKFPFVKLVL